MTLGTNDPVMMIALRESTVALLMRNLHGGETLDQAIERVARRFAAAPKSQTAETTPPSHEPGQLKYQAVVLGQHIEAQTLGSLFAKAVDLIAIAAPEAIEQLAQMRARSRVYVAVDPTLLHAGRTDLRSLQSESGWWVSANISEVDLKRGLKALCRAAGLRFGSDLRFWRRR